MGLQSLSHLRARRSRLACHETQSHFVVVMLLLAINYLFRICVRHTKHWHTRLIFKIANQNEENGEDGWMSKRREGGHVLIWIERER